jgi:hypothetical protein
MTDDELARFYFRDSWYAQVPRVHRWLRGDERELPVLEREGHDYWFAAYYVCRAILGWSDCGLGVQRLAGASVPTGPTNLLRTGWRDRLDALGLWAWITGEGGIATRDREASRFGDEERVHRAEVLREAFGFTGGYDPHHLGPHLHPVEASLRGEPQNVQLDSIRQDRRVVLFVDRFDDWPTHLHALTSTLSGTEPPSWRIDIVSRREGFLGQWRRCWDCRRWFQGSAEHHKLGHPDPH